MECNFFEDISQGMKNLAGKNLRFAQKGIKIFGATANCRQKIKTTKRERVLT